MLQATFHLGGQMKNKIINLLCLITFSTIAFGEEQNKNPSESLMLKSGFFTGLGSSYDSAKVDRYYSAAGISDIYLNGVLVSYGQAGGPTTPFHETNTTFAPLAQLGYYRHFSDTNWLWGGKLFYQYEKLTFTQNGIETPQYGSFKQVGGSSGTFLGHVVTQSFQTSINHELALLPFFGYSFTRSYVYLGLGVSVFQVSSKIYNVVGFADLNGVHVDVSGTPTNFTKSEWMWGGIGQLGVDYFLNSSWFLDICYTYTITGLNTFTNSALFASEELGYTDTGTLYVRAKQRVNVQGLTVSINKVF